MSINIKKFHEDFEHTGELRESVKLPSLFKIPYWRMNMKALYVSDLDGTLLNRNEKLSDITITTINALVKNGVVFSYATARSFITASKVTTGLDTNFPAITYNGAFIVETVTKDVMLSNYFTKPEVQYIKDLLIEHHIFPIVYAYIDGAEKFSYYVGYMNQGKKLFLDSRKGDIRRLERNTPDDVYVGKPFYFTCIGDVFELAPIYDIIKNDPRFYSIFQKDIYSGEQWLEILPAQATKANAILQLKNHLDCDKVVSFGDGKNDIPMFTISDECYAVGNAAPELKRIATAVIDTNENDGVAKWLKENLL